MKTEDVNVDVLILINRAIKVLMDIGCNDDQVNIKDRKDWCGEWQSKDNKQ